MSGEDCISRARAIERLKLNLPISQGADGSRDRQRYMQALADIQAIRELPSVTPQEPQTFKWCTDCKEYDQDEHCCHRWSKVIRDTVEEMKQEYIERDVLDKIREEIKRQERWLMDAGYNQYNVDIALDTLKSVVDKCKAEGRDKE